MKDYMRNHLPLFPPPPICSHFLIYLTLFLPLTALLPHWNVMAAVVWLSLPHWTADMNHQQVITQRERDVKIKKHRQEKKIVTDKQRETKAGIWRDKIQTRGKGKLRERCVMYENTGTRWGGGSQLWRIMGDTADRNNFAVTKTAKHTDQTESTKKRMGVLNLY